MVFTIEEALLTLQELSISYVSVSAREGCNIHKLFVTELVFTLFIEFFVACYSNKNREVIKLGRSLNTKVF